MDENTVLEIISGLRKQIAEVKGQMREQHRQEIAKIEAANDNEKLLLEQKYQEEIGGYQDIISRQQEDLYRLERDNGTKDDKIGQMESAIINKDEEIGRQLQELKTKNGEYNSLQTRFNEKVNEINNLNRKNTTKDEEIANLRNEIRDLNRDKTTMQTTINNKNTEISHLNSTINDKGREIRNLETKYENSQNECRRLQKFIDEETIRLYNKGNYDDVNVYTNKMSSDKKDYGIEITRKSLNMYSDHQDCAKYIKEQFQSKYGGYWGVVLLPRYYGSSFIPYYDDCYLNFAIGQFEVVIEKTSK